MSAISDRSAENTLLTALQSAMQGFAKSLGDQVITILRQQQGKAAPKALEAKVTAAMPEIIQRAFITGLLAEGKKPREARLLLSHVLTTAELQNDRALRELLRRAASEALAPAGIDELTSEEAAKLLFVSRTHVNKLVEEGLLGDVRTTNGGHRRIPRAAVLAYKVEIKRKQATGLDKMMEATASFGGYDEEMAALPVRGKR